MSDRADLRTFLRSNMFDGDEAGVVTMRTDQLLDDVCDLVLCWLRDDSTDEPVKTVSFDDVLRGFGLTKADL